MNHFVGLLSFLVPRGGNTSHPTASPNAGNAASPHTAKNESEKEVQVFFTQTRLGLALRSHLNTTEMESGAWPGPSPLNAKAETILFNHYSAYVSEATRQMVEYGDAALATCRDGSNHRVEARTTKRVWEGRGMDFSTGDAARDSLPSGSLDIFEKRWLRVAQLISNKNASASNMCDTETFPEYLAALIPGWCALLEVHSSYWTEKKRCDLVEACLLPSLTLLKQIALQLTPSRGGDLTAEEEEIKRENPLAFTRNKRAHDMAMLVALQRLLHFLHILILLEPGSPIVSELQPVVQEDGISREQSISMPSLGALINRRVILDLLSLFSFLAQGARCIFDAFESDETEGCDFELTAEGIISSSFTVALSIVSHNYPHSELSLVVKNVVTAINALLHRLVHLESFSKPLVNLLLRQVIPGLEMLSDAIRLNPLTTVNVLKETSFHTLMAEVLRQIGYRFNSPQIIYVAGGDDDFSDPQLEECEKVLQDFMKKSTAADPLVIMEVEGCNDFFPRLAADETVDELLGSFISMRDAQRVAIQKIPKKRVAPEVIDPFRQLDAIVVRIFLSLELLETVERGLHEDAAVPDSCLAEFLCRYTMELLSWTQMGHYSSLNQEEKVEEFRYIAGLGLYHILLTDQRLLRSMEINKRILYTVVRIFSALSICPTQNIPTGFTTHDREGLMSFLFDYITNGNRLEDICIGRPFHDLQTTLFRCACAVVRRAFLESRHASTTPGLSIISHFAYDRRLMVTCAQLASHKSIPLSCFNSIMAVLRDVLEIAEYKYRAVLDFPDALVGLLREPETRSFGADVLSSTLQSYALSTDERLPSKSLSTLSHCFWTLLDGKNAGNEMPHHFDLVISLVDTLKIALDLPAHSSQSQRNVYRCRTVLQNQLCASDPWFPNALLDFVKMGKGSTQQHDDFLTLASVMDLLFNMVRGNPERRKQLASSMNVQDLFEYCESVWKSRSPMSNFHALVKSFLHFAFEDDGNVVWTEERQNARKEKKCIHHPSLLIPVVISFTRPHIFNKEQDALDLVLGRLDRVAHSSFTDCFYLSKSGLFNVLGRLLPLCHCSEATLELSDSRRIGWKERIMKLMSFIGSHHIDVRHLKQFISTALIHTDVTTRRQLLPDVAEVLRVALKDALSKDPQTYISFRPGSGRCGVRAELPEVSVDGYSVSMWFQYEEAEENIERTLFAVENNARKTVIKCFVNSENSICVSFLDRFRNTVEVVLGGAVPEGQWSHVVVTHQRPGVLQVVGKLELHLNGEIITSKYVRFPKFEGKGCAFYVGSPGSAATGFRHLGLLGRVTNIYFFPKPISNDEAKQLFNASLRTKNPIPYFKGPYNKTKTKTPPLLRYYLGELDAETPSTISQPELPLTGKASVYVDPRVGEKDHLYNVAEFMQGNATALEKDLVAYEGTEVISGVSDMRESLCLTGAVNFLLMPMLVLLVDPRLPFPQRWSGLQFSVSLTETFPVPSVYLSPTLLNVIDMALSLVATAFIRECMVVSGVFVMMSFVIERLGEYLTQDLPHRLMELCLSFSDHPVLFPRVYSSLFLCADAVHALPPAVQLQWWRCQLQEARNDMSKVGNLMRKAEIQMFVVQELLFNMEYRPQERAIQEELYNLLDAMTVSPITQDDATPLLYLTVNAHELFLQHPVSEEEFTEALYRIRMILYTRGEQLSLYLSQSCFMAAIFPLLSSTSASVRREAVLLTCILVKRSKKIQRLMNPTLEDQRVDVVHAVQYVELGWIGILLSRFPVDVETYLTLRTALTGDRIERKSVIRYKPLIENIQSDDMLPHILSSISQVLISTPQTELKVQAAMDLAKLIEKYPWAPKRLSSLMGWYASVTDLYCSYFTATSMTDTSLERHRWQDQSVGDTNNITSQLLVHNCSTAIGACLLHILCHESYGQVEYPKVCGYLMLRGAHSLLCRTLQYVTVGLGKEIQKIHGSDIGSHHPDKCFASANLHSFIYTAEDYIFYSHEVDDSSSTEYGSEYVETDQLYLTPFPEYEEAELEGWLHLPLALQLCLLLTSHESLLKGDDEGVMDWLTGHDWITCHDSGDRTGGLHRVFTRLVRVAASFTLRCTSSIETLQRIAHRYCLLLEPSVNSAWNLRQKRVVRHWSEVKNHSVVASTMFLIAIFDDLINRRLSKVREKSEHPDRRNEKLIATLKKLFVLFKAVFEQFSLFLSPGTTGPGNAVPVLMSTFDWLCDMDSCYVKHFKEVVTREDYKEFIAACRSVARSGSMDNNLIAGSCRLKMDQQHQQLREDEKAITRAQQNILKRLQEHMEEHVKKAWWPSIYASTLLDSSFCGSFVRLKDSKASTAMRSSAWSLFRARMKGSMWLASDDHIGYWRLSLAEQRSHCRRKLLVDPNGTDHRDACRAQLFSAATNAQLPLRSSSLSQIMLFDPLEKDDSLSQDDDPYEEESDLPSLILDSATNKNRSTEDTFGQLNNHGYSSFQCEVVHMMQCWSAVLTLQSAEVCIAIEEVNSGQNPPVAKDSERYLMRPESTSFPISAITHIAPGRRYRMKRTGLEVWFRHQRSILLNFTSVDDLSLAMEAILRAVQAASVDREFPLEPPYIFSTTSKEPLRQHYLTKWKSGAMTNFDYLMCLNFLGGRSVNDLSQYPVFPWVLKDYDSAEPPDLNDEQSFRDLSKPVGVCASEERANAVRYRYEEQRSIGEVPAHYFSHYSSPAVVTFFLIRLEPFTSLHLLLQGGTFDFADRMFHSVPTSFKGVTTNIQDVRELVPEMYYLPELCLNHNKVKFGVLSNGETMNNLLLPPWSHGCPYQFVYRMREALESDYVSRNLNHWIDLIFGCKQRGKAAVDALNVFQCLSYEEVAKSTTEETGIQDFFDTMGQTPIQLFKDPHPARRVPCTTVHLPQCSVALQWVNVDWCPVVAHMSMRSGDRVVVVGSRGAAAALKWSQFVPSQKKLFYLPSEFDALPSDRGTDSDTPRLPLERKQSAASSGVRPICTSIGGHPTKEGSCLPQSTGSLSYPDHGAFFIVQGGLFDNTVVVRPITTPVGKCTPFHLRAHHSHVTHIAVSEDSSYIATGARDSTFIIWSCVYSSKRGLNVTFEFMISIHDEDPGAVAVCRGLDIVVTASVDGVLLIHSLSGGYLERRLCHPLRYSIDHILIQQECYVPNILIASNTDCVVHQLSINGAVLRSLTLPGSLTGWCCGIQQYTVVTVKEIKVFSHLSGLGAGAPPPEEELLLYFHSFFLTPLNKFRLPSGMSVTTVQADSAVPGSHTLLVGTCGRSIGMLNIS